MILIATSEGWCLILTITRSASPASLQPFIRLILRPRSPRLRSVFIIAFPSSHQLHTPIIAHLICLALLLLLVLCLWDFALGFSLLAVIWSVLTAAPGTARGWRRLTGTIASAELLSPVLLHHFHSQLLLSFLKHFLIHGLGIAAVIVLHQLLLLLLMSPHRQNHRPRTLHITARSASMYNLSTTIPIITPWRGSLFCRGLLFTLLPLRHIDFIVFFQDYFNIFIIKLSQYFFNLKK